MWGGILLGHHQELESIDDIVSERLSMAKGTEIVSTGALQRSQCLTSCYIFSVK